MKQSQIPIILRTNELVTKKPGRAGTKDQAVTDLDHFAQE